MTMLPTNTRQTALPNQAGFFDPSQELEAKRKRAIAEQLLQQYSGVPKNEMGGGKNGGYVVARSPIENINQAAQLAIGQYNQGEADRLDADTMGKRQKLYADALSNSDPREAARLLAQDPQSMNIAAKLYSDALNNDQSMAAKREQYSREDANWQRDADLKRELARMRAGSSGATVDPDTGEIIQGYSDKPLPVGALKLQQEAIDALANSQGIAQQTGQINDQIAKGQLKLGPVQNIISGLKNWAGASDPQSLAYGNLDSTLEKIRNDSLRLNKGVQTEGDAERAMNEVLKSRNDPQILQQAMAKLQAINQRGAELQKVNVNQIRQNYNAKPYDFGGVESLPSATPPVGGQADKIRQYLTQKGLGAEKIDAYLQSKGIK